MLQTFRTKPTTIQAVQLTEANAKAIREFIGKENYDDSRDGFDPLNIMLRGKHGIVLLCVGDWLAKEAIGNGYYPIDNETFRQRYEAAAPQQARPLGAK